MTTQVDFRNRVKAELGIVGASAERGFDDAALLEHIQRTVEELSLARPLEAQADVLVTGGSRSFALSALTRPVAVLAVEYPAGLWPPEMLDTIVFGGAVRLDHSPPASNYTVRVYYEQRHLVDGSGSTVAAEHEWIVVVGACAYAVFARTAGFAQSVEISGTPPLTYPHLRLGEEWRRQYQAALADLRRQRPRRRRMYSPGTGRVNRDVVEWPS